MDELEKVVAALEADTTFCRSCRTAVNVELELRLDAVRPFLQSQLVALRTGMDVPADRWVDKLMRDAALHAADPTP